MEDGSFSNEEKKGQPAYGYVDSCKASDEEEEWEVVSCFRWEEGGMI